MGAAQPCLDTAQDHQCCGMHPIMCATRSLWPFMQTAQLGLQHFLDAQNAYTSCCAATKYRSPDFGILDDCHVGV